MTPRERDEALAAWNIAVNLGKARRRALGDVTVSAEEYGDLAVAEANADHAAVVALGGYLSGVGMPSLTAWPGAR